MSWPWFYLLDSSNHSASKAGRLPLLQRVMTGNVADLAATGQHRTAEQEEEWRLECLAKFWIGLGRKKAAEWLEKQKGGFADDMRARMNNQVQIRREGRS